MEGHAPIQREIHATFNQPACIIIAKLKLGECWEMFLMWVTWSMGLCYFQRWHYRRRYSGCVLTIWKHNRPQDICVCLILFNLKAYIYLIQSIFIIHVPHFKEEGYNVLAHSFQHKQIILSYFPQELLMAATWYF